eukprot:TRINITY_DN2529_c0_g1_i2.p1 TRINITY_DN2529_c0_g1~~TRINITY_DN2529_c0_g1_i2.p1  ORF type:complete len:348 (+),score=70.18 TRINITY_DN2529_c0_g1_i2:45-1088(+)
MPRDHLHPLLLLFLFFLVSLSFCTRLASQSPLLSSERYRLTAAIAAPFLNNHSQQKIQEHGFAPLQDVSFDSSSNTILHQEIIAVIKTHTDIDQSFDSNARPASGTYFGQHTDLKQIWDSLLISTRIQRDFHNNVQLYVQWLVAKIKDNVSSMGQKWIRCTRETYPCFGEWKDETLEFSRWKVMIDEDGGQISEDFRLGEKYYQANWESIEQRLAIRSYRLSATLNQMLSDSTGRKKLVKKDDVSNESHSLEQIQPESLMEVYLFFLLMGAATGVLFTLSALLLMYIQIQNKFHLLWIYLTRKNFHERTTYIELTDPLGTRSNLDEAMLEGEEMECGRLFNKSTSLE